MYIPLPQFKFEGLYIHKPSDGTFLRISSSLDNLDTNGYNLNDYG